MGGMLRVSNGLFDHYYYLFILPHHKYNESFASTRAVRLFLRAQAVISFFHASSEHFRNYTWRAASSERFVNSPLAGISLLFKKNIVLRQVIWLTPSIQDNRRKARKHVKILSRFNHSQKLAANYALFNMNFLMKNYLT